MLATSLSLALAACGSSSSKTTSSSTTTSTSTPSSSVPPSTTEAPIEHISVEAAPNGEFHYTHSRVIAGAGVASITFANSSPVEHNMTIENSAHQIVGGTTTFTGGSHTIRIKLAAGTYKFFCTVPGHRQAGMEGTLEVR